MIIRLRTVKYTTIIGSLVTLWGVLSLIGWQLDIPALTSIFQGITPMDPVTAYCLVLSGVWLIFSPIAAQIRVPLAFISLTIIVVGFVHFITYLHPVPGLRFDYLFYKDKMLNSDIPNMIAPNTALVFLLNGVAMLFVASRKRKIQLFRQVLMMLSFSLVYISLVGYIYNVRAAYKFEHLTPIALNTTLAFIVLNMGMFLSNTQYGFAKTLILPFSGGRLARVALPLMIVLPLMTGYLWLLGEHNELFSIEYGLGLHTVVFTLAMFVFIGTYAYEENKRQLYKAHSEAQLEESERRYRTLLNTFREGVISMSPLGRVLYCNPGFCSITGYTEQEVNGRNAVDLFIPKTERIEFYRVINRQLPEKEERKELEIIKKDGLKIWVAMQVVPIQNKDNDTEAYLVTITDITEERMQLQDLKAFSASAAHDLNSPLARITMVMGMFETGNLDEEQKMFLDVIDTTAKNMRQLLNDLLTFSRLGAEQLERTDLDILEMVHHIVDEERPKDYAGEIIINALPPVYGNEGAVRQLFTNLISNAIKYSSKNPHPRIEIGSYKNRRRTVYYVTDNGVGMSEKNLSELFTPFKRFHHDFTGNGMGLAIVKRVVEKHGGSVWAESAINEGTTFNFTLPYDSRQSEIVKEESSYAA